MSGTMDSFSTSFEFVDCKTTERDMGTLTVKLDSTKTTAVICSFTLGDKIQFSISDFYIETQEEGGFVVYSREFLGAVGQGETVEEAMADIQNAIRLLKEVVDEDKQAFQNKR
jgi:predicted RNase H-like HicB family nuclease